MSTHAHGHGSGGCGSGACQCSGGARPAVMPAINGITLVEEGEELDAQALVERAWSELLRQEAVRRGLLPRHPMLSAPDLSPGDQQVIQAMLDDAIPLAEPSEEECRRYYDAQPSRYTEGQAARLRHILFAVTEGVDVEALARRAEAALLELSHKDAADVRFALLAAELSNCPSGAEGGAIGWVAPGELADEIAREIFHRGSGSTGLQPRLLHSRYGLHIMDVLERRVGRQLPFEQVKDRIAGELAQRSRATALHQYIRLLAGEALVEGVELDAAATPLVQ